MHEQGKRWELEKEHRNHKMIDPGNRIDDEEKTVTNKSDNIAGDRKSQSSCGSRKKFFRRSRWLKIKNSTITKYRNKP